MTNQNSQKSLVLVDGSSYLYRAFHALPPFTTSKGEPTGALYGVTNMLIKLINQHKPDYCAVVFDAKGKTFRDDLFAEYKAHRKPMPDDLKPQVEPLLEIVEALGLPMLRVKGVEADDVIGTLAKQAHLQDIKAVISTSDKDMAQLVNGHIVIENTMTGKTMDHDGVVEKFDVRPDQIIDYLALVGDSSDNIPGVPKVGPKTAAKWLKEYDTIDNIVTNAEKITGKVGESLRDNLSTLELSKKLATIKCDVELEAPMDDLLLDTPDEDKLRVLYTRWEMKSFLRQLNGRAPSSAQSNRKTENDEQENETPIEKRPVNGNYTTIFTQNEFDTWLGKLKKAKQFAFDTETTSIDYMQAEIVGVSFAVKNGEAAYVPLAHDYEGAPKQLSRNKVLAALKSLLEDQAVKKIGHHLKYDAHVLQHYDVRLRGIEYDTMMESFVWNSTATRHDLDSVAEQYLGLQTIKFEDVAGKGKGQKTFNEVELEIAAPYAAEDADITLRVHESLWPNFEKTPSLKTIYQNVEKPLIPVLQDMEHRGVLIDSDLLAVQSGEIENKLNTLEQKAFEEAGREFNISSTKQLGEILFDQMGLPIIRKTPKGAPSTAEDVLQELAGAYTLPQLILDYRSLSKLKSTYTDKLPKQVNPKTGRVHTSYHQAVAATGRLSSSDPNLQNIPIRTPEGRRIREAFIAPKGYKILAADYSQIELRIMAHLSGDQGLLNVFKEDRDVHQATAAEVFGLPLDKVSKEERRSAKAINFGLMYGMSAFGLAKQLNISRGAAQDYIDIYFDRYPGVKNYMDRTREQAKNDGYVETVFGRRLYLQDIRSSNHQRRQYAERAAINAPMQGTNADIIKLAMIDIFKWIADKHMPLNMIMQVHDELVFEVKESDIDTCSEMIVEKMISAAELSIPLKVEAGVGDNWQEAH